MTDAVAFSGTGSQRSTVAGARRYRRFRCRRGRDADLLGSPALRLPEKPARERTTATMTEVDFHGVFPYLVSPVKASGEADADVPGASAHIPVCVMTIGGGGWMAGPACVAPRQSVELYELCRRGDRATAMARQRPLWNLNRAFARYNLAVCIKGALERQGHAVGAPLPPQAPLPPEGVEEVRRALVANGAS